MIDLFEKRIVRYPLYICFVIVSFALCLSLTFPGERVGQIIEVQAESALGPNYKVNVSDVSTWWMTGITMENVNISERIDLNAKIDASKPPQKPLSVTIPQISARLAIIRSIINLGAAVEFEIDFEEGGDIDGHVIATSSTRRVDMSFNGVDLRRSKIIQSLTGVPGFGMLDGDVDIELDAKGTILAGKIDLTGSKVTLGPGILETNKIPSMVFIDVPQTNFGNLKIKADVVEEKKQKKFVIKDINSNGRDVEMQTWGDIKLNKSLARSILNLSMRMNFKPEYIKKNSLGSLLSLGPLFEGKGAGGWHGFTFSGTTKRLRFKGNRQVASGPSKNKKPATQTKPKTPIKKVSPKKK